MKMNRWRDRQRLQAALKLYLVMDLQGTSTMSATDVAQEAIFGGVTTLQLRDKKATDQQWLTVGAEIKKICAANDVLFVINDRFDMAAKLGADGVHVGQDDADVAAVRAQVPKDIVVGLSVGNHAEWELAKQTDADYYGVGAVYATASKADAGEPIGTALIREIVASSKVPVVGIGGIDASNLGPVVAAGACGVAVLSAIGKADDPLLAAAQICAELENVVLK